MARVSRGTKCLKFHFLSISEMSWFIVYKVLELYQTSWSLANYRVELGSIRVFVDKTLRNAIARSVFSIQLGS